MGKDKLKRFNELKSFKNFYQNLDYEKPELVNFEGEVVEMKGKWQEKHFGNSNPLTLELACGKGEYTFGLAKRHPNRNFIGVDIKGARIHKGAKEALQEGLDNAAYLRTRIELLPEFFASNEVDQIWIVFSDPFPKDRHAKHRLTSPKFLELYKKICSPNAIIHLKTDSELLFNYTLGVLDGKGMSYNIVERDIYNKGTIHPELTEIQTFYEKMHIEDGRMINYVQFKLFQ
ncbi:MAG: tRNA (guanosine(46)-N7)-methyltransferase TrmB [Chitinophagales bacterium]|nr:tRNA (guanosine(46)-N7)-methyltransferase TrmB [Chitinophagales bacterium]